MKASSFFYDTAHMDRYLRHCVLMYRKEPVLVNQIISRYAFQAIPLRGSWNYHQKGEGTLTLLEIPIKDPDVVYGTVPTGFVNYGFEDRKGNFNYAASIYRIPSRAWKVGLTSAGMGVLPLNSVPQVPMGVSFYNPGFVDMCVDSYPSLLRAYQQVAAKGEQVRSCAFHRNWALGKRNDGEIVLFYRLLSDPIGFVRDDLTLLLHQDYFYFQQKIELEGHRCELSSKPLG